MTEDQEVELIERAYAAYIKLNPGQREIGIHELATWAWGNGAIGLDEYVAMMEMPDEPAL